MRVIILLLLLLSLSACAPAPSTMPAYVVMLTNLLPNSDSRCTGVLLDSQRILTANHCAWLHRAVTESGQEVYIYPLARWPDLDIALMTPIVPLYAAQYASLAEPDLTRPAYIFGFCPHYFSHVPRDVVFSQDLIVVQRWLATVGMCGGDSGGPLVQDGNVIAIVIAGEHAWPGMVYGQAAYAVPVREIAQVLGQ